MKTKVYDLSTSDGTFIAGTGRVICHNTDGVYFSTSNINKQEVISLFEEKLKQKFKKDLDLSIDIDEYDKGYFYKTKNYVLQRGKNIIFHGVAMKASSKNIISKSLISELSKARLNDEPTHEIITRYRLLDFPLEHFAMSVTLGMHMRQYKNLNALAPRLALKAEQKLDVKPEIGTQYHYIKSHTGYKLLDFAQQSDIDMNYYLDQVNRIIKIFDAENVAQNRIDKWF